MNLFFKIETISTNIKNMGSYMPLVRPLHVAECNCDKKRTSKEYLLTDALILEVVYGDKRYVLYLNIFTSIRIVTIVM